MLTIKPVSPARTDVMHLIEQLDAYQSSLYPPGSNHLDSIDEMSKSNTFFLAAYSGPETCGIGSVKLIDDYGEIKRVYVPSNQRGKGIAKAIMKELERYLVKQAVIMHGLKPVFIKRKPSNCMKSWATTRLIPLENIKRTR